MAAFPVVTANMLETHVGIGLACVRKAIDLKSCSGVNERP
jgi:hypothetical protein